MREGRKRAGRSRVRAHVHWLAPAVLSVAMGCGGGDTSPGLVDHSEVGSYTLATVNGQAPPVTIAGTSLGTVVIQGTAVTLASGATSNSYTATVTGSVQGAAPAPFISDAGTYVRTGSTITFTSSTAPLPYTGSINSSNGNITVALPGIVIGISSALLLEIKKS
jgi:hypothetical protein